MTLPPVRPHTSASAALFLLCALARLQCFVGQPSSPPPTAQNARAWPPQEVPCVADGYCDGTQVTSPTTVWTYQACTNYCDGLSGCYAVDWQSSTGNCWVVTTGCSTLYSGVTTGNLAGIAFYSAYPIHSIIKDGTSPASCLDAGASSKTINGLYVQYPIYLCGLLLGAPTARTHSLAAPPRALSGIIV
jgi:hypothetical protein